MKFKLKDICTRLSSGKGISSKFISDSGKFPVYGGNGLRGYTEKSNFTGECAIIGRQGAFCGNVRYFFGEAYMTEHAVVVCANEKHDTRYLSNLLASMQLGRLSGQSAQPGLSVKVLAEQEVDMPPLAQQKKVTSILASIENKIELNNKINKNLEQQALALFRHYFMDFEPYGCSVPSNWSKVSLDDVCTRITDGSHYSPSDVPGAPYPMYSVKNMETYGFDSTSCKHITAEDFCKMQKNDCVPRLNDILVAKDGSYLKEIFICSEEKDEAILSSIAIFRPNTEVIIPEILLYLLKQPSVRKDVGDNYVSGSALPRIVLKDFKKYTFLLPPMTEQLKIAAVLHAIRRQTKANIDEIQNLSALRDTLLPQLMSGELDVSDINL